MTTKNLNIRETEDGRVFIQSVTGWISQDFQQPSITTRRLKDGRLVVCMSYKNAEGRKSEELWQYANWLTGDEQACGVSVADVQYSIGFYWDEEKKEIVTGKPKWLAIRRHDGKVIAPSGDKIQFEGRGEEKSENTSEEEGI